MRHPGRRAARAALRLGLLGLLALPLAGCGLFQPTSPEVGDSGTTLLPSYADPESCLKYMAVGIEYKDNVGLTAYIGALADSAGDGVGFHAFFDAAVWNAYTGVKPDDWDRGYEETQFYPAFIALRGDPYDMEWLPDEDNPLDEVVDDDHVILHRRYQVHALSTNESLLIAVGYADLYFTRLSASRWALTRWQDRVAPDIGVNPVNEMWRTIGYWRLNATTGG
jgi:hypothetical protein